MRTANKICQTKRMRSILLSRHPILLFVNRMLEDEVDELPSDDDVTSSDASELKSEIAKDLASGYSEAPMTSVNDSSLVASQSMPLRERGHSFCVLRTTALLHAPPEPRSKSLRIKRIQNESSE